MKTLLKMSIVVLFVSFLTMSCEKDENLTELDKIELEVKTFASNNKLTRCTIREHQGDSWVELVRESPFTFSNGFIVANQVYPSATKEVRYNLLNLYSYQKADNSVLFLEIVKDK
ncbi:MAG: hypothetical protein RBR28_14175 [Lentimicrobium sp.]|jgi:hypothetical protein|nr:hypothetical protein [Lentimicrobium sp.]